MDKYKDFRDLQDTDEKALQDLFNKRIYENYIEDPLADDIVVGDAYVVEKWNDDVPDVRRVYSNPNKRHSTFEERMKIKNQNASASYTFTKINEFEEAKFELQYLNPTEIENRYLRKRVEAYCNFCNEIIKRAITNEEVEKTKLSWRRVYSFILTEAYKRGERRIGDMSKKAFINYITLEMGFKGISPYTIYQSVRSTYRGESKYLNFFEEMKNKYPKEYAQAMKLFGNYYPNLQISQDKM